MGLLRLLYTVDRTIAVAGRIHRTAKKVRDSKLEADAADRYQQYKQERETEKMADDLVHEYGVIVLKNGRPTADLPSGKLEALARELGVGAVDLMAVIDQRAKVRLHQDRHLGAVEKEAAKRPISSAPRKRSIGFEGDDRKNKGTEGMSGEEWTEGM